MGFFNTFQYTNFHELNLDWLLKEVAGYEDIFKEIKQEWLDIWGFIDTFPTDMYKFAAEFNQKLTAVQNDIRNINYLYDSLNYATPEQLADQIAKVVNLIETNVITLKSDIALLYTYIDIKWADQKRYIDRQDKQLNDKIDAITIEAVQDVVSPFTKKIQSIQDSFDEIYGVLQFFSLTAREYDYLYLTAEDYDKLNLSAIEYDIYSKFLLGKWIWQKTSPMCLTADEYSSLDMSAQEFDDLGITGWQYDERSLWYFANYPLGNDLKYL